MHTPTPPPTTMLDHALAYARRGLRVFPLHTPTPGGCSCRNTVCTDTGKHPRTSRGCKDATTDETAIRRYWEMWSDANIGIATGSESGIVVLDVDPAHGGRESLDRLEQVHGPLPSGPRVVTGSGGLHVYFKHPGDSVRNSAGTIAPGIDVRGDGGYVVAPPSLHASGERYRWEDA